MNYRLTLSAIALAGTGLFTTQASAQTLTTVTAWNFNNNAIAVNTSPVTSTGTGTASTLGMNIDSSTGNVTGATKDTSDINTSTPLSTDPGTGGVNSQWRIRGGDGAASPGTGSNAWTSLAPVGSQGAQFAVSTAGYTSIHVSFDWSPTTQGEGKLQAQYTLNGTTYLNVPISLYLSLGTGATAVGMTNTTSANTVMGGYLAASSSTAYMNGISIDLSSIAGANNNPNFAVRFVNAATGADDTNVAGAALNNTSGNWRFDEVTITGVPEPGTYALSILGLVAIALIARRTRGATA